MRAALKNDLENVLNVLVNANHDNPSVLRLFKSKPNNVELKRLFGLLISPLIIAGHVYITDNNLGVAVIYPNDYRPSLTAKLNKLRIALGVSGLKSSLSVLKTQKKIDQRREDCPHLYFWMLAVDPSNKGLNTIIEIRDFSFSISKKTGLPILAETPMKRTKRLYERYGFNHYNSVVDENGLKFYLLKRN